VHWHLQLETTGRAPVRRTLNQTARRTGNPFLLAYRDYRAPTLWANQSVARDGSISIVTYPLLTRLLPPCLLALVQRLAWPQDRRQKTRGTGNLNQVQQVQWQEAEAAASGGQRQGRGREGSCNLSLEVSTVLSLHHQSEGKWSHKPFARPIV
jgi:hypothetical protein